MKATYQGKGTLENVVRDGGNTLKNLFRWYFALDYIGDPAKYKLHKNTAITTGAIAGVMSLIPGSQLLVSGPSTAVCIYNATRAYKDHEVMK